MFLAVVAATTSALAAPTSGKRVDAALISEMAVAAPGQSFWAAVRFDIAEGWHTYWRNPGDSGEPTRIVWQLPPGVEVGDIQWPAPERIPFGPLTNFGYGERVLHLARITVPEDWPEGSPLRLNASATWLVCKEICIPEDAELALDVPVATESLPSDTTTGARFAEALAEVPAEAGWTARYLTRAPEDRSNTAQSLDLIIDTAGDSIGAASAYFFPQEWGAVDPLPPQRLSRDGEVLTLAMVAGDQPPGEVLTGVLVLNPDASRDDPSRRAFEISAVAAPSAATLGQGTVNRDGGTRLSSLGGTPSAAPGMLAAIGLALLGGLLLNVMPCVFPVLSMKAMGVVRHASDRRALRLSGLSYVAGILVFIGLVAGLLIGLKAAGEQIGWGFQLQSPSFVSAMALIVFALGLSLSGVFTIGASAMGWGEAVIGGRSGPLGSFLTGALAALVATPCTAPFMGIALGFALTQPWPSALAVFLALGLGLALPYLVLTFVPGLARLLPRPGAWMERLKQLLAFPLYVTAAWLVWVLALQGGASAVFAVLIGMILVAFAVWLSEAARTFAGGWRRATGALALAAGIGALALALWPQAAASSLGRADGGGQLGQTSLAAEPYSAARLDDLRARDIPTFVNLTAAWCITCQVNERVALSSERVARTFRERGVVYLKGDWTNRDPEISRLLDNFGRSGVPLYLLYWPGEDAPVVLPQLLTETTVIEALGGLPLIERNPDSMPGSMKEGV